MRGYNRLYHRFTPVRNQGRRGMYYSKVKELLIQGQDHKKIHCDIGNPTRDVIGDSDNSFGLPARATNP